MVRAVGSCNSSDGLRGVDFRPGYIHRLAVPTKRSIQENIAVVVVESRGTRTYWVRHEFPSTALFTVLSVVVAIGRGLNVVGRHVQPNCAAPVYVPAHNLYALPNRTRFSYCFRRPSVVIHSKVYREQTG